MRLVNNFIGSHNLRPVRLVTVLVPDLLTSLFTSLLAKFPKRNTDLINRILTHQFANLPCNAVPSHDFIVNTTTLNSSTLIPLQLTQPRTYSTSVVVK